MFQLIESIRIENRKLHHLDLHNARFNRAVSDLFGLSTTFNLKKYIKLPATLQTSRYKCRIVFDGEKFSTTITPYQQREVKTLKLIEMNAIDYTYKTSNRILLDKAYAQKGNCDDVIIVKENSITDTWAANVILFDGSDWFTPSTPLLKGVQREYLLRNKMIHERVIKADDLPNFQKIKLINAMIDFERSPSITIDQIK